MQAAIAHRGPDNEGTERVAWQGGQLWLGNRRLRVLDTRPLADQPWHYPRQNPHSWLSYNGELYNYVDLRNELLQQGYQFSSGSDTEVILYALDAWGEKALSRFQGMFALVYCNLKRNEILLARDRHGMKPLYWSQTDNYFVASSEIKGILASGIIKSEIDKEQVNYYLRRKYAKAPATFFKSIYELEPGHYRVLTDSLSESRRFITPTKSAYPAKFSVEILEELLVDSLYRHVQSHRPLGLFLSGGSDSTLILALMRKHLATYMPLCYTVANNAKEAHWGTQDYLWAQKIARQFDAQHEVLELNSEEVLGRFSAIAQTQDQPVADGAYWLTYLLCEKAAPTTPVVFSGAGADEYFAGYYRLKAFQLYLQKQGMLKTFIPMVKTAASLMPVGFNWPGRAKARQLQKFMANLSPTAKQTWYNFTNLSILSSETENTGFGLTEAYNDDIRNFLIQDVLAVSDRAGMQHGVEIRMPFLDDELVDWVSEFEAEELLVGGRKWMLHEVLNQQPGGKAVSRRRKEGFGMPFGAWVKDGRADFLFNWLSTENELHQYLPTDRIKTILTQHQAGKADFSQELLAVAGLTEWLKGQLRITN
jgi:asparagine synthase (glutamine-hydrolysing)